MADLLPNAMREASLQNPVAKPGLGLPLGHMPEDHFPSLYMNDSWGDCWQAPTLLIREACMMKLIDELFDKPEWWRKVQDDAVTSKWKQEALAMDWTPYRKYGDFTEAMADACIAELRKKAHLYEKTGLVPVYDYAAAVIKSDSLMSPDLADSLREAVKPLEDVPPEDRDWHPGSRQKVLDLVHPSLWPLTYGRSRVLRDRVIGLEDALANCGTGTVLPVPDPEETKLLIREGSFSEEHITVLSNKFQWLPCDVNVDPAMGSASIASYINNLHPEEHARLYPIIEAFIEKALPAWDVLYCWEQDFAVQRLKTDEAVIMEPCPCPEICNRKNRDFFECKPSNRPLERSEERDGDGGSGGEESNGDYSGKEDSGEDDSGDDDSGDDDSGGDDSDDDSYSDESRTSPEQVLDHDWFVSTHKMKLPDAEPTAEDYLRLEPKDVKTSGFFGGKKQIQVIVKLANIHLTPGETPSYSGGSWHTEGQLNEHIVATALYYYDTENITDCTLDFRTCANEDGINDGDVTYEQDDHLSLERTFAIAAGGNLMQDIGSVRTRAGRALFFPNTLQHHVSPFRLADPTKPGHRKILALFLVDPAVPIISTSNVPPQQRHWWAAQTGLNGGRGVLPPELAEKVVDGMEWPIGLEEARELRLELMADRTWMKQEEEERMERQGWNFCEH